MQCDNSVSVEVLAELTVVGYDSLWVNTLSSFWQSPAHVASPAEGGVISVMQLLHPRQFYSGEILVYSCVIYPRAFLLHPRDTTAPNQKPEV